MIRNEGEVRPPIDFVALFNQRFNAVKLIPDDIGREIALITSDIQIDVMRRRAPVIVFTAHTKPSYYTRDALNGLWMEPPESLEEGTYPHNQIERKMRSVLFGHGLYGSKHASAYLFQDGQDQRHLVLDGRSTWQTKEERKDFPEDYEAFWVGLARRYNISTILGSHEVWDYKNNSQINFVNSDLLGKIREKEYLAGFAKERHMTVTQYLRFRTLIRAALEAQRPIVYSKIANEVVNPDTE